MMRTAHAVFCSSFLLFISLFSRSSAFPHESFRAANTYDFIVVGGGTAGNAVATRLSQYLPDSSILVIEAGLWGLDVGGINVPGMKGSTLGTIYDWNFTSVPQPSLLGRTITQSRGRVVGGSSALNLLIWDRAPKPEYDAWEQVGNPGWNWDSMIRVMNKAENFTNPGPPIYTGTSGYGVAGPMNAVIDRYIPRQQDSWIPTLENLGVAHNSEWLAGENVGVAYHSSAIDPTHYNRSYSAVEYLPRAGSNLHVMTDAEVAKIEIDESNSRFRATGVTLLNGRFIRAAKEVVLSADTAIVEAAGLQSTISLSGVRENLQDHHRIQASYLSKDSYTSLDKIQSGHPAYAAHQLSLWEQGKYSQYDYAASGYSYQNWTSILGEQTVNLVEAAKQVVAKMNNIVDNTKLEFLTNATLSPGIAQAEFILSDGFTTIIAGVMHPLARGSVHINDSDASVQPVYDPAFASNEYDFQALLAMIKYIRTIANTAPFSDVWQSEYEPGFEVVPEMDNEEEWVTYVRNNTNTFYHPVGTCAMLPKEHGGVVDSKLLVYGTSNLRVVDASVIPILVSAHPQSGVYGIAERAAEIISECW